MRCYRKAASKIHPKVQKGLFLFAVSNSCMDPIVYGKSRLVRRTRHVGLSSQVCASLSMSGSPTSADRSLLESLPPATSDFKQYAVNHAFH